MCSTKNLSWKKCNIISSRFCWIGWKHDINFLLKSYIPFFLLIGQTHCPSFKQEVGATCILSWIPLIFSQVPAYSASDWLASLAQPQWQKILSFLIFLSTGEGKKIRLCCLCQFCWFDLICGCFFPSCHGDLHFRASSCHHELIMNPDSWIDSRPLFKKSFLNLQALGKASCILKSKGLEPSEVRSHCY